MKFFITDEQEAKIDEWVAGKQRVYTGAIGGRFTYSFTPTSIGVVVKVYDCIDKDELDISDYDSW